MTNDNNIPADSFTAAVAARRASAALVAESRGETVHADVPASLVIAATGTIDPTDVAGSLRAAAIDMDNRADDLAAVLEAHPDLVPSSAFDSARDRVSQLKHDADTLRARADETTAATPPPRNAADAIRSYFRDRWHREAATAPIKTKVIVEFEMDCDGPITRFYKVKAPDTAIVDPELTARYAIDTEQVTSIGSAVDVLDGLPPHVWDSMDRFSRDYWRREGFHSATQV